MRSIYSDYPFEENQLGPETLMQEAELLSSSEDEHFETLRQTLIPVVEQISVKLRHLQSLKKIAKEANKSLLEEPNLYFQNLKKDSHHQARQRVDSDEANKSDFK